MLGVAVVVSVAMFEAQQGLITVGEFIYVIKCNAFDARST